ncbi:SPOSA6832_00312, partial [Sporobolomyces salmonicolor]
MIASSSSATPASGADIDARASLPSALQPPSPASRPSATPSFVFSWHRNSPLPLFPLPPASAFFAGAVAGAASRTVVSPLERLKILLQIQGNSTQYKGVLHGLKKMWQEEGFRGYMRGNGINVLRIAPYSAVQVRTLALSFPASAEAEHTTVVSLVHRLQFSSYELFKGTLMSDDGTIDTPRRLIAGSFAGIASVVSTYRASAALPPHTGRFIDARLSIALDLVRSRLSVESASLGLRDDRKDGRSTGIVRMTLRVYREEGGLKALYRGLIPTAAGVAPYVGGNFAVYEALKQWLAGGSTDPERQPGTMAKLVCGGIAGAVSQTLTYPFDLLRRRFQMVGLKSQALGYEYTSIWGALSTIVRREGFGGLYKGIWPNLLKCMPAMATSFGTYEAVKDVLDHLEQDEEEKKGEVVEE